MFDSQQRPLRGNSQRNARPSSRQEMCYWREGALTGERRLRDMDYHSALVMRCGESPNLLRFHSDIVKCLDAIHKLNYVHSDVRLANLVQFGDQCQLVDFGTALRVGERVTVHPGVRWDMHKQLGKKSPNYDWSTEDDKSMLELETKKRRSCSCRPRLVVAVDVHVADVR